MKTKIFPALVIFYVFQTIIPVEAKGQNPTPPHSEIDYESNVTFLPDSIPKGIRAVINTPKSKKSKTDFNIFTFDYRTMAMQIYQGERQQVFESNQLGLLIDEYIWPAYENKKQTMYFDKEGYIYTWSKKGWYKTPFVFVKTMMKLPFAISNSIFPENKLPDGKVKYYGIDVSPDMYPILEWAFKYKVHYFESAQELKKEFIECGKGGACFKYTAVSGKDKGSYVLFDNWGRLIEINSAGSGNIIYVYGDYSVTLPDAKLIGSF